MSKVIHNEIKKAIDLFGLDVLSDQRILYILSDFGAFDKLSDDHDIVKDLQLSGFGSKILEIKKNNDKDCIPQIEELVKSFILDHSHYDSADVDYICRSIAFGAGLIDEKSIRDRNDSSDTSTENNSFDFAAELKKLQKQYLSLLTNSIVIPPASLFKRPSGYYPIDAQNKIYLLENKICMLGHELGKDLSSWCAEEKQKVLDDNTNPLGPQRWGWITAIGTSTLVLVLVVINIVSYLGAKESIVAFNNQVSYADSLYQSEDYLAAISAYNLAGNNYQESYKIRKHQNIVQAGVIKSTACWIKNCLDEVQKLYNDEDYYGAQLLLLSKPEYVDCSLDNFLERRWDNIKSDVGMKCDIAISTEIDNIISTVSKRKGKIAKDISDRVDYLLTIDPDNYWLLFIKNKSVK